MFEMNNLKIGQCITNPYGLYSYDEGVIVNIKNNIYDIIWLKKSSISGNYFSEYEHYDTLSIKRCIFQEKWILTPIPHFCKMENLYNILNKYTDDGYFNLFGINRILKIDENNFYTSGYTDAIYLITNKNTILEIIICYAEDKHSIEEPIIWINEFYNIEDILFLKISNSNYESKYYHCNDIVRVKIEHKVLDFYGILLSYDNKYFISISTTIKQHLRKEYSYGLDADCYIYQCFNTSKYHDLNEEEFKQTLKCYIS